MGKKLTDEEIVKGLEHKKKIILEEVNRTNNCLDDLIVCVDAELIVGALDLIHRLQSEKTEQKEIIEKQVKIYDKLEEAYGNLVQENAEQKEEIERLTEELDKEYDLRLSHQFAHEKKDLELKQLEFENAELQKQVGELENRFENKAHCNMSENCSMVQQAVKGTAKEIFNEVMNCIGSLQMFWIVDGKARTLVDAEKLFEESCKIAKKHGICLDEEETKDKAKTVQWSKYEVE